jgi:hypothetical protein
MKIITYFSILCLGACSARQSGSPSSVPDAFNQLNRNVEGKLRLSQVLEGLGIVVKWSPEAEDRILLDSDSSFGEYDRTFRWAALGDSQQITMIGVGTPGEVAGGDFLVDEMRVGKSGAGTVAEIKYRWRGMAYVQD